MPATFSELFSGYENAHGIYRIEKSPGSGKVQGRASTRHGTPTDEDWKNHLSGKVGLGIIPLRSDNTVHFAAIDIDDFVSLDWEMLDQFADKYPVVVCRSKSGGAHIYAFFPEPEAVEPVYKTLKNYAGALGYPKAEIFPKQLTRASDTDVGNWINLPYYHARKTERYAIVGREHLSFEEFLDYATERRVPLSKHPKTRASKQPKVEAAPETDHFADGPPCLDKLLSQGGFTPGTRNEGLFNVAVYLRKRYPGDWQEHLDTYNQLMCESPLSTREVEVIMRSANRKDYRYRCQQEPIKSVCMRELCRRRLHGVGATMTEEVTGIEHVTLYEADPHATWVVQLTNGSRFECDSSAFTNQNEFARYCFDKAKVRLPPLPAERFAEYINRFTVEASVVPPFEGTTPQEIFVGLVVDFCTSIAQGKTKEDIVRGQPWHYEGKVYFRPAALVNFLHRHRFVYWNQHGKIGHYLWKMSGGTESMLVLNRQETLWWIPDSFAAPPDEPPLTADVEDF
jgi:hypothetical protein